MLVQSSRLTRPSPTLSPDFPTSFDNSYGNMAGNRWNHHLLAMKPGFGTLGLSPPPRNTLWIGR